MTSVVCSHYLDYKEVGAVQSVRVIHYSVEKLND